MVRQRRLKGGRGWYKALLEAGKVVEICLGERTLSGHLTPAGSEGLLPKEKIAEFQQSYRKSTARIPRV